MYGDFSYSDYKAGSDLVSLNTPAESLFYFY